MLANVHGQQTQLLSWLQEQQRPRKLRSIMEKERNKKFLRQAEEKGYLQTPTEAVLIEASRKHNPKVKKIEDIWMVRLCGVHLRDVGSIWMCSQLRVCNLAGNYIRKFEELGNCPHLIKLDLHSNQISQLPGHNFWASLPKLKILYLHDNSIGRLEYVQHMGSAANLQILTLFDTPISLKFTYRHHVVNSIWSLKMLDFHVISDEEIIEDAFFGGHFSTLHSAFSFNHVASFKKDASLAEELSSIRSALHKVSCIQAKHSPVLIIQRYIRGWVARKKFKIFASAKIWAAVTIQRYWRVYKGLEWKPPIPATKAPPPTAALSSATRKLSASLVNRHPKLASPGPAMSMSATDGSTVTRMDYDTYLMNRRPGSKSPSLFSTALGEKIHEGKDETRPVKLTEERESVGTPTTAASVVRRRTNIVAKLQQLQTDVQVTTDEESLFEDGMKQGIRPGLAPTCGQDIPRPSTKKPDKKKKKKSRTVKEMLGPLSDSELQRERSSSDEMSDDEEEIQVKFRLSGLKPVPHTLDPLQELLISRREAGKDVRNGMATFYAKKAVAVEQPKRKVHKKPMNADQRLFSLAQGTMGMSCLKAVQQAYRDREAAEKRTTKSDNVAMWREQRDQARLRAKSFLEDKRLQTIRKRDQEINVISQEYEKQANKEVQELERRREIRNKASEITNRCRKESTFCQDFTSQYTSISNALVKHDRQERNEKIMNNRLDFVQAERDNEKGQSDLVHRYLEHKQLMRQAQVAVERAALDTRLLQDTNERLMEARENVSRQKQKAKRVQPFYPLPKCATHPVLPPVRREGKPDKWNTLISMYEGRVGNHPAVIGT